MRLCVYVCVFVCVHAYIATCYAQLYDDHDYMHAMAIITWLQIQAAITLSVVSILHSHAHMYT